MTNVVKVLTDLSVDINEGQSVNMYWTDSGRTRDKWTDTKRHC